MRVIGHAVNPNVAMVTGFSHADEAESRHRSGRPALLPRAAHHYIFGEHQPGRTDIWANFEKARHAPPAGAGHGIGTPDRLRLICVNQSGVDQTVFIQRARPVARAFAWRCSQSVRNSARGKSRGKETQEARAPCQAMARKLADEADARRGNSGLCRARRKKPKAPAPNAKQNAKRRADAAKVTLSDPLRQSSQA
jgi:hypothetical protein